MRSSTPAARRESSRPVASRPEAERTAVASRRRTSARSDRPVRAAAGGSGACARTRPRHTHRSRRTHRPGPSAPSGPCPRCRGRGAPLLLGTSSLARMASSRCSCGAARSRRCSCHDFPRRSWSPADRSSAGTLGRGPRDPRRRPAPAARDRGERRGAPHASGEPTSPANPLTNRGPNRSSAAMTSMPVSEARARLADLAQRLEALGRFL